ncbi:MAG: MBL fold metallo-hydrolase [Deltaproteobacteria bacterium]|nr:MBL fold metallo-hydrolase [Deltaproteobacteria bacterium]
MIKSKISENFYKYCFPPKPDDHYGYNIYALISNKRALLIDTGYEEHALVVKEDLLSLGIEPVKVIISHFHDDHTYGLHELEKIEIYGSSKYIETLNLYTSKEKHELFTPTYVVDNSLSFKFGDFDIELLEVPGHAECGLFTVIDKKFIHIGDDLMSTNEGLSILPSVEFGRIYDHIKSLEKLKEFRSHIFLQSHGKIIDGTINLFEIENRLKYLKAVYESSKPISYELATKYCECPFLHEEWHNYFYE